jgi:lysophospholipase L1-like esterase
MVPIQIFQPEQVFCGEPPAMEQFGFRFLAEGDSWFTIGTLNPLTNGNLLFEMGFSQTACVINCATPGDTLSHMSQMSGDPRFADLLAGPRARYWDAILMSCGGNDVIDALASPAVDAQGQPVPADRRLLLTAAEWGPPEQGAERYLSDEGWRTFCTYLEANFRHVIELRERGPSAGRPIFVHGYAFPTPRPSGIGVGVGPWLLPALQAYGIPAQDGIALARELLARLGALLAKMAADSTRFPRLYFFDSTVVPVDAALPDTTGDSGDWANEIHLTRAGYRKLAARWAAEIERVLLMGVAQPVPVVSLPAEEMPA